MSQLRTDVERLCAPGTRKVGSSGHGAAREYIAKRMSQLELQPYGADGFELPYTVESHSYINLAGILPGVDAALPPFLLVAHYDTCGDQPGADDNAAAISVILHLIKKLKSGGPLKRDLIVLIPDAEEPPHFLTQHMGSTNFYQLDLSHTLHCGIVLDLVGHDVPIAGLEDLLFMFGAESHPRWADLLSQVTLPESLKNIATLNRYVGDLSDHHILRENDEAYLFLTCGRWEHYHAKSDVPGNLNYSKMKRISEYILNVLLAADHATLGKTRQETDPIELELFLLKRALGPYLEANEIELNDRNDVQKFVLSWVREFGL